MTFSFSRFYSDFLLISVSAFEKNIVFKADAPTLTISQLIIGRPIHTLDNLLKNGIALSK